MLPFAVLLVLGRWLGRILRPLLANFRKTATRNMELCLPQAHARGASTYLVGRHFESLGIALFETGTLVVGLG